MEFVERGEDSKFSDFALQLIADEKSEHGLKFGGGVKVVVTPR